MDPHDEALTEWRTAASLGGQAFPLRDSPLGAVRCAAERHGLGGRVVAAISGDGFADSLDAGHGVSSVGTVTVTGSSVGTGASVGVGDGEGVVVVGVVAAGCAGGGSTAVGAGSVGGGCGVVVPAGVGGGVELSAGAGGGGFHVVASWVSRIALYGSVAGAGASGVVWVWVRGVVIRSGGTVRATNVATGAAAGVGVAASALASGATIAATPPAMPARMPNAAPAAMVLTIHGAGRN